jgi:hypothetical protein
LHFLSIHPDFMHQQAQVFLGDGPVLQELFAYQPGERVDMLLLQDVRWRRGLRLEPGDVGQDCLALRLQFVSALAQPYRQA